MARRSNGEVLRRKVKGGTVYAIRFRAYGKRPYITLGGTEDGWSQQRAEQELRHVLADVERGVWQPPTRTPEPEPSHLVPTFHEFASQWLANREPELRPKTIENYKWQLSNHLLPHFAAMLINEIGPADVDSYKALKLRGGRIAPNQINKTLGLLGRILRTARRYGHLEGDPLADVDRLRRTRPARPTMEPEQLPTVLDQAGHLRPILATLAGAGLRDGEACALNWGDVNLASGTLTVRASKTQAGIRKVDLPLELRGELKDHKIRSSETAPADPVFTNLAGRRESVSNLGRRLKTVLRRADVKLVEIGLEPIGQVVTPYSFRRPYASLRYALRDDPIYVASQMGHADDGGLSMSVYATALRRRERLTGVTLAEFDKALAWAAMGRLALESEDVSSQARVTV